MFELDEPFVKSLLLERFGKLTVPRSSWPKGAGGVNRTTLWRSYQSRKLPTPPVFFCLAGALDVDPMAIIAIRKGRSYPHLFAYFQKYLWALSKPKEFENILKMSGFITCKSVWPCEEHSKMYYARSWFRRLVKHDAGLKANYYGKIEIRFKDPGVGKVVHFAWSTESGNRWNPYGTVRLLGQGIELLRYDGFSHCVEAPSDSQGFTVETWFGAGSADFTIASIHEFEIRQVGEDDPSLPVVGFWQPGER